jgi:hypothetical protein
MASFPLQGKIKSLEQIYLFSMPVKEYQIVENFLGSALKDEVMKIMPVQKQTRAGQRTRFKVGVVHLGQRWAAVAGPAPLHQHASVLSRYRMPARHLQQQCDKGVGRDAPASCCMSQQAHTDRCILP